MPRTSVEDFAREACSLAGLPPDRWQIFVPLIHRVRQSAFSVSVDAATQWAETNGLDRRSHDDLVPTLQRLQETPSP